MTHTRLSNRGFVIAPVLYALGLVGVLGGVTASYVGGIMRTSIYTQNTIADRNAVMNTSNLLVATSVIGSDGVTFCPPRSSNASAVCLNAPASLTQIATLASEDPHLPSGAFSATSTGSPYEVGVFAAGASFPQTDAEGHYYVVCRWESLITAPASLAFQVLAAGRDGVLQTHCGDTAPRGDDLMSLVSVGETSGKSSAWFTKNGTVSFGASGSQTEVDSSGNINATSLTTSGNVTANGSATIAGTLSAGNSTLGTLSATTGTFSGTLTTSGQITAPSLSTSNATLGSTTVSTLNATGAVTLAASLTVGDSLHVTNEVTANKATLSQATITDLHSSTITAGTTTLGATSLSNLNVSGDATINGTISGANGNFTSAVTASAGNLQSLTVTNGATLGTLTVSGASNLGAVSVTSLTDTGALTGTTATFSGLVSAGSFSLATPANLGGGATISGGLLTAGTASLGATTVASLVDTGSAAFNSGATVTGGTLTAGTTSLGVTTVSKLTDTGNALIAGSVSIGATTAPLVALDLHKTTSAIALPVGTDNNRPTGAALVNGEIRYNSTTPAVEAYVDGAWTSLGSSGGGSSQWITSGSDIYYAAGNVAIGTTATSTATLTIVPPADAVGLSIDSTGFFGHGVEASNDSTSSAIYGSNYSSGVGVRGESSTGYGVSGYSRYGTGVYGNASNNGYGVYGQSADTGYGLYGDNYDYGAGTGYGVYGVSGRGYGVYGVSGSGYGVYGEATGGGIAVYASSVNGNALYATAGNSTAIYATSGNGTSIDAESTNGTAGNFFSSNGHAIYAVSSNGDAAYFSGTNGSALIIDKGNVGIGTAYPAATVDIIGTLRLSPQTKSPMSCSNSTKGSIAFASTAGRFCVCNGTKWIFDYSAAACTW